MVPSYYTTLCFDRTTVRLRSGSFCLSSFSPMFFPSHSSSISFTPSSFPSLVIPPACRRSQCSFFTPLIILPIGIKALTKRTVGILRISPWILLRCLNSFFHGNLFPKCNNDISNHLTFEQKLPSSKFSKYLK